MAKVREEIVGKRFLSVSNSSKLKLSKISEWDWRAGVIRACTHTDSKHPDLQILVEYEDVSWQRREWIHVHRDRAFQVLLVEHTLVWTPRRSGNKLRATVGTLWPALVFDSLVDEAGLNETKERPVEFLTDRALEFQDYSALRYYQDDESLRSFDDESESCVRRWVAEQDGQRILCTTPSVLVGFRVQVYRSEGTTQWYTAVIVGYNETTRELTVTDDTVLEEHSEDPSLVHIRLLGEGVVESILRGENIGITPRRSRSSTNHHQQTGVRQIRREQHTIPTRGRKTTVSTKNLISSSSPLQVLSPPSPTRPTSPTSPLLTPIAKSHLLQPEQKTSPEIQSSGLSLLCFNSTELSHIPSVGSPLSHISSGKSPPGSEVSNSVNAAPKSSTLSLRPPRDSESLSLKSEVCKVGRCPSVESPPRRILCTSLNRLNSPSSPTNPDKPTNPRQNYPKTNSDNKDKFLTSSPAISTSVAHLAGCPDPKNTLITSLPVDLVNSGSKADCPVKSETELKTNDLKDQPERSSVVIPAVKKLNAQALKCQIAEVKKDTTEALKERPEKCKNGEKSLILSKQLSTVEINQIKQELKVEPREELKEEPREELKVEPRPELKVEPRPELKVEPRPELKVEPRPELKVEPRPELKVEPRPELKVEPRSELKVEPSSELKVDPRSELKVEPRLELKVEPRPELKVEPGPELKVLHKKEIKLDSKQELKLEPREKTKLESRQVEPSEVISQSSDTSLEREKKPAKPTLTSDVDGSRPIRNQTPPPKPQSTSLTEPEKESSTEKDSVDSEFLTVKAVTETKAPTDSEASQEENNSLKIPNLSESDIKESSAPSNKEKTSLDSEVTLLSDGRVHHTPILLNSRPNSTSAESIVPDFVTVKNNNSYRQLILLSSEVTPYLKGEEKAPPSGHRIGVFASVSSESSPSAIFPSISIPLSSSESSYPTVITTSSKTLVSTAFSNLRPENCLPTDVELAQRIFNTDCTLSLSRVGPSSGERNLVTKLNEDVSILSVPATYVAEEPIESNLSSRGGSIPPVSSSGGSNLVPSLAAASAVTGRAVTITATSGPAPLGASRVASPPSVSITAVVRSPNLQSHHQADPGVHHHDGVANPLHPHPIPHPHFAASGPLSAAARMDQGDGSSDSGVSVTERSVSRSSVLSDDRSSSAEVKPNTPTPTPTVAQLKNSLTPLTVDRKENVKIWRNPAVLSQPELSVRHIHSLQHSAMSQHFAGAGIPPHLAASTGAHGHPSSHPSAHGPPSSSLSHALPPGLHYPGPHGPPNPLHLSSQLQPLNAGLYQHMQSDVWKQLGHVNPLSQHAYASLLPRHQEDFSYLEQLEKQKQQADRIQRERREAEAREKQAEKMERERTAERQRKERERREREDRGRRPEWGEQGTDIQMVNHAQLVNKHFEDSVRYHNQKQRESHLNPVFYGSGLTNQQAPPQLTSQPLLISHHQKQQSHQQPPPQQNKIYQTHSQKSGGPSWGQPLANLSMKVDHRDHRQQPIRHQLSSQQSESMRKAKDSDQFVQDSIYKAFRAEEPLVDAHTKSHNPPPPAHSKHPSDKVPQNLAGYPSPYATKDLKHHLAERNLYPLHQEKASVIVQPELKYDKVPQHSLSPKQRPIERSSPYSNNAPSNHYKSYDPSPPPHRGTNPVHSVSLSPSSHVELSKARQQLPSPHTPPTSTHNDRYYSAPGTKPPVSNSYQPNLVSGNMIPNHLHMSALPSKAKVSSPPPQMYGKPGITSGTPVCSKVDTRPCQQPILLTSKVSSSPNGPPPAHSGNRNHDARPPPAPHEQRLSHNQSPYDARIFPGTGPPHPKTSVTVLPSLSTSRVQPTTSPQVSGHQPQLPAQTQPLDLGTKDGGSSPTNRRRSQTPTPQESKKPRLDSTSIPPMLSRVSEPSPLYPTAAATITTVENTVSLASLHRVNSPVSLGSQSNGNSTALGNTNNPSHLASVDSPYSGSTAANSENGSPQSTNQNPLRPPSQPPQSSTPNSFRAENNSSPGSSKQSEPEKCNSPGLGPGPVGGYVHKLLKAKDVWKARYETGTESPTARGSSPPTTKTALSSIKHDSKNNARKKPLSGIPNGHGQDSKDNESTSTDTEDTGSSRSAKRSKTKRSNMKRPKKGSESNSDSDKESDGSEGSVKKPEPLKQDAEPRRRGRKPKSKPEKEDGTKLKKPKDELPQSDPLLKPPVSQLKKTGESFLQDRSCYEVAPKLPKCRECRWTAHQRNKKMPNIFCRFYAFRRLRYTKNGQLAVAGFSDPVKDSFGEDKRLWVPDPAAPAHDLDSEMSKFLLTHVGDQFCDLVQQEKEAMALHMGEDTTVAWKRVVQGVREMCDVCETTLFNIHWACSKCGFVVCIDCYKGRKEGTIKVWDMEDSSAKERDKYSWLLCASRIPHEQDKLMLTQIIAGNALTDLGKKIHEVRYKWGIPQYCGCPEANKYKEKEQEDKKLNGINKDLLKNITKEPKSDLVNGNVKIEKSDKVNGKDEEMSNSPLNFFADVALSNDKRESETSNSESDSDSDDKEKAPSTLRELLVRPNAKSNQSGKEENGSSSKTKEPSKKKAKLDTLDDVISCVIDRNVDKDNKKDPMKVELKHFVRKYTYNRKGREPLPIRIMTKTESRLLYPTAQHSWLCDGKLLRLQDIFNKDNLRVFQDQWKRGQPVIVSGAGQNLNADLWKPSAFARDFGEVKNNLINCLTDNIVPNQPMKKFWDGFENYGKRLKDDKGQPMILKLKDWPPGDDFAEMLPKRYEDLMKILPMGEYTRRNGCLNLAGRLPECFVRPDLGPKMYIAYGSATYPSKASTNLHLDISDAVNVMCYVGIPKDKDEEEMLADTLMAIDDAGCDVLTRARVREKEEVPGALWHIYHARDSDKIRDLLNKVAIERGKKLEPFHDPIHDQSWYLDGPLRERLYKEYAVEGYAIIQCMGDAVFIPAGAPHQVRNLQNCIKVAEDFVSPENVSHCFHLTQEFRHLSDTHTNHEDKLQIKNIIYHAMKDSLATLLAHEQNNLKKEEDDEDS